ncbi:MAG: hypothetical protein U9P49_05875 [Thermodesulfobacteriota bacterium]|nr:hypothetical protein [Thermodesulfobacteriota bacterium]
MSQNRDEIIQCRLNKMTEWAKQRRFFLADPPNGWGEDWYIRIGGNGYTAVSLDLEHPLLGFASGPTSDIKKVISHFEKEPKKDTPDRSTPEKRAQAWLIKQAINDKLNLKTCLGLNNSIYDELLFALDEVSFGDQNNPPIRRLDILALGKCDGNHFPVFIELKSGRNLGRLLVQLKEYQEHVQRYKLEFEKLLSACTNEKVDLSKCGRIIVWPRSKSDNPSREVEIKCGQQKVTIIESAIDNWTAIKDFSFQPRNQVYPPTPYIGES